MFYAESLLLANGNGFMGTRKRKHTNDQRKNNIVKNAKKIKKRLGQERAPGRRR